MVCDAKKLFLAGVGAAVVSYEKGCEVFESLEKIGRIAVNQGMELSKELKRNIKQTTTDAKEKASETIENMKPLTKEDLNQILQNLSLASKGDILELKRKIETLEEQQLNSKKNSLT